MCQAAPRILPLPKVVEIEEGSERLIPCGAEGWPTPTIKWKRDTQEISESDDFSLRKDPNENRVALKIKSAEIRLQGNYTCEAMNAFGKASQTVTVDIEESSPLQVPEIIPHPRYKITTKGSNVTLTCDVLYVSWFLSDHYWLFNGTVFYPSQEPSRYREDTVQFHYNFTMVLHILNVSEKDEGRYECEVFNLEQKAISPKMTVIVDVKDNVQNISTKWETTYAALNTQVQLKCTSMYKAFLEVATFWMFQGNKLNQSDPRYKTYTLGVESSEARRKSEEMILVISNVSESDFGTYTCALSSSFGMSTEKIALEEAKHEIEFTPSDDSSSSMWIILFPVVAGGILLALIALVSLRRMIKKRQEWKQQGKTCDGKFKYDVFVTFSNKDRHWVASNIIPLLEGNQVKYCIHSRDFELGRPLTDNMAESVYSSRKVLAVMSKNYLDSKFCKGELEMALYRSKIAHEGSLLVVRIDGIRKKKLPKALREQIFVDYHSDKNRGSWEKRLLRFLVESELNQNRYITKL
ncbi:Roundabout-like 2 [Stylophora pistillata]|uniref:Soluble interferon alpha/beta receptor OPG204 n=1 Tax=Stylophora pistillata TaxID=50429 RepID=A0A2B4SNI5_STYPI|nr:Roundabout-like 2 [Stylophora pistillata]